MFQPFGEILVTEAVVGLNEGRASMNSEILGGEGGNSCREIRGGAQNPFPQTESNTTAVGKKKNNNIYFGRRNILKGSRECQKKPPSD